MRQVVWPKLVELCLTIPFVLGFRTTLVARLLVASLVLESLSCWSWFLVPDLEQRLHAREHFTVNIAVAGGLLLIQEVGGGKYTVDALLKKHS